MRSELVETAKSIPAIFSRILDVLNGESVLKAIEYYRNFCRDAHSEKEVLTNKFSTLFTSLLSLT